MVRHEQTYEVVSTPSFLTHHEVNALTSPKRRERWEKSGLLPRPAWVRVDRARVGIYPELVLARIAAGSKAPHAETGALGRALQHSQSLCEGATFEALSRIIRSTLADLGRDWDFTRFLRLIWERGPEELEEWRGEILEAERSLAGEGIVFEAEPGRLLEIREARCRVAVATGETLLPETAAPAPLEIGLAVVIDRVSVGAIDQRFLLPGLVGNEYESVLVGGSLVPSEENMMLNEAPSSQPGRLATIAERSPMRARAEFGVSGVPDPRAQFDRGFIPSLHIGSDRLPDSLPTFALTEAFEIPAFG